MAGWPLHNVAHMLGHANIAQTSTYLKRLIATSARRTWRKNW
jgi:hypothetical protein